MTIEEKINRIQSVKCIVEKQRSNRTEEETNILIQCIKEIGSFDAYGQIDNNSAIDILTELSNQVSSNGTYPIIIGNKIALEVDESLKTYDALKKRYETFDLTDEERILIHCTNYFPENHTILSLYDGKKEFNSSITENGIKHDVAYRHHRHTSHFVSNGVVENTGDGNTWNNIKYIIVEPYQGHQNEFASLTLSDSYSRESVHLSNQAVLLVNAKAIDELSEQQKKEYKIVLFEGDFRIAVKNYLILNNKKIACTNAHSPNHAISLEMKFEELLNYRDKILNYYFKKIYDGTNINNITIDDLIHIIDLLKENYIFHFNKNLICKDTIVNDPIMIFLYASGFKRNSNGTYSLLPETINYNRFTSSNIINENELNELIEIKNDYKNRKKLRQEIETAQEIANKENEMLNKKVSEIQDQSYINSYLEYVTSVLREKYKIYDLYPKCFVNKIAVSCTTESTSNIFSQYQEYDEIFDQLVFHFNQEKTLLENIQETIKKINNILYEVIQKMESTQEQVEPKLK